MLSLVVERPMSAVIIPVFRYALYPKTGIAIMPDYSLLLVIYLYPGPITAGPKGNLMQKKMYLYTISLILLAAVASAQKTPEYMFPTAPFNEAETEPLMAPGNATIHGNAFLKKKGQTTFAAKGSSVLLFPVTPYFTEFIELKKKYNGKKKIASVSNVAFTYRIEGKYLDNNGNFEFTRVKPGKYYIITWVPYEKKKHITVETGRRDYYNPYSGGYRGTDVIYSNYTYGYSVEDEVTGVVEVKGTDVTNVVVSN